MWATKSSGSRLWYAMGIGNMTAILVVGKILGGFTRALMNSADNNPTQTMNTTTNIMSQLQIVLEWLMHTSPGKRYMQLDSYKYEAKLQLYLHNARSGGRHMTPGRNSQLHREAVDSFNQHKFWFMRKMTYKI